MRRAFWGAMVGATMAGLMGFSAGVFTLNSQPDKAVGGVLLAVLLAGNGAMAGAIIGGVGDVLAYLREALPVRHSLEDDYRDQKTLDSPAGPTP